MCYPALLGGLIVVLSGGAQAYANERAPEDYDFGLGIGVVCRLILRSPISP